MIAVNDQLPTSTLLELKVGDTITSGNQSGIIQKVEISETDEFLMFLFQLESNHIMVRKLKQVC